jgi:pimeloyl-ACP methyl ester carboxylesterase
MLASHFRRAALVFSAALIGSTTLATARVASAAHMKAPPVVHYHTVKIDGVDVFYREAGPSDAPVVLLLHGFPTSSHMFRRLIPALADRYHVIAPDYPGFGESAAPDHTAFAYTFAHYSDIMDGLMSQMGATRYALYLFDYGAPVGYRMALKHPERVSAMIVQNGNAYDEGLKTFWDPIKVYWGDHADANREAIGYLVTLKTTKFQYLDGVSDPSRVDPDNWGHDQPLLERPGNRDIQLDLFEDYGSNVPLYPAFQKFFRDYQPPTLVVWGKNDKIFPAEGAYPYKRDLPHAEYHMLDTGHFLLEDKFDVAEPLIHRFLDRNLGHAPATSAPEAAGR